MSEWKVAFFNASVKSSLANWPIKMKAKFIRIVELIELFGPIDVGMPHVKNMGKGLFEIRTKSQEGIGRAFFCMMVRKEIIILHSFIKKTQKTSEKEIEIARKRMNEVMKDG